MKSKSKPAARLHARARPDGFFETDVVKRAFGSSIKQPVEAVEEGTRSLGELSTQMTSVCRQHCAECSFDIATS